jgi:hypothetical protein
MSKCKTGFPDPLLSGSPVSFIHSSFHHRFMGLPAIDFFIGPAVRANTSFNGFYKPEDESALFFPCPDAYGTPDASLCHCPVFIGYYFTFHNPLPRL